MSAMREDVEREAAVVGGSRMIGRGDLAVLTKARLSSLVVVTTAVGYVVASREPGNDFSFWKMVHTVLGTSLAAFGAAVFNQLMEIDVDSKMERTADRPLPSRRVDPAVAFGIGLLLAGFGLVHLSRMTNLEAAALAAATLVIYLFVYTPLKRRSSWNTVVGAVSGALPPLVGWAAAYPAAAEGESALRAEVVMQPGALFLFLLLFLWQLPHFFAINWIYRSEYQRGGFVMLANDDETGAKTAGLALLFSGLMVAMLAIPAYFGFAGTGFVIGGAVLGGYLIFLSARFWKARDRPSAMRLFFGTLIYLPLVLVLLVLTWEG